MGATPEIARRWRSPYRASDRIGVWPPDRGRPRRVREEPLARFVGPASPAVQRVLAGPPGAGSIAVGCKVGCSKALRRWYHVARCRISYLKSGAPGGTRTHDLRFRKPLLYPLSYRGAKPILYLKTVPDGAGRPVRHPFDSQVDSQTFPRRGHLTNARLPTQLIHPPVYRIHQHVYPAPHVPGLLRPVRHATE